MLAKFYHCDPMQTLPSTTKGLGQAEVEAVTSSKLSCLLLDITEVPTEPAQAITDTVLQSRPRLLPSTTSVPYHFQPFSSVQHNLCKRGNDIKYTQNITKIGYIWVCINIFRIIILDVFTVDSWYQTASKCLKITSTLKEQGLQSELS